MPGLVPRYVMLTSCIVVLALMLLALVRSYAQPSMYAQVSEKSFWSMVSTSGHLHWVSFDLHRDDTTFAAIAVKEHALGCNLRLQPQQYFAATGGFAPPSVAPLIVNVDFPLEGRYFPQWSNITIPPPDPVTGEPAALTEEIKEVAIPYWCPVAIAMAAVWASTVSLRSALRRLRLARIGRCACCGHELGPTPDRMC